MNRIAKRFAVGAAFVALTLPGMSTPAAAQSATVDTPTAPPPAAVDTAQVSLQPTDIAFGGHLTFNGHGFAAGESASVTIEDGQGGIQSQLQPLNVQPDGQIYTVSLPVPAGLGPGPHTLHITGLSSGRNAHSAFNLQWQSPTVHLDAYTGKPNHALGISGSGFVPGEAVDVYLGQQTASPFTTTTADGLGNISVGNINVPFIDAGNYTVTAVGHVSQTPTSVGFNIQGFHPWVVLANYYVPPQSAVSFTGQDFVPGESVEVYLNTRMSQPVTQVTADADGHFAVQNGVPLTGVTGDNQLIFVGQQSQTEVTTSFRVQPPAAPNQ